MSTPSRTPAASVLWGHLLRKNTLAGPPAAPLPPTAPLDKTGTSMRILLHDTQANFEKFSVKVDTLTSGIDQAKREIGIVKDLFQADRESLTLDVVDLVNRSQTQIQKSLGDPAQGPILESFRKEVDARLNGLSKRFDDLQAVNQMHSQTLQNISQTLLNLQDQQGKIVSALLPLLPLLQAVPVHIDSARSSINETVLKASMESARTHRTPPHVWHQPQQVVRKRSFPTGPPSSPLLAWKRPRLDDGRIESLSHFTPNSSGRYPASKPPSRRQTYSAAKPYYSSSAQVYKTPSLSKPHRDYSAPRRPLGDLPVPRNDEDARRKEQRDSSPPPAHQTPLPLLRSLPQPDSGVPRTPPFLGSASENRLPSQPQRPATPTMASSSPVPSPSKLLPSIPAVFNTLLSATNTSTELATTVDVPALLASQLPPQNGRGTLQSVAGPPKAIMVRGRRSPFRDGRRFIPLNDDDSDSDDD